MFPKLYNSDIVTLRKLIESACLTSTHSSVSFEQICLNCDLVNEPNLVRWSVLISARSSSLSVCTTLLDKDDFSQILWLKGSWGRQGSWSSMILTSSVC